MSEQIVTAEQRIAELEAEVRRLRLKIADLEAEMQLPVQHSQVYRPPYHWDPPRDHKRYVLMYGNTSGPVKFIPAENVPSIAAMISVWGGPEDEVYDRMGQ